MHELKIYYSIQNGGDGSAYPSFMESNELTEWDQEHMYEGWGETCNGGLVLTSDSPISINTLITTKEGYLIEKYVEGYEPNENEKAEFIKQFFPDGLPNFTIGKIDENYSGVYVGGKLVYKKWGSDHKLLLKHLDELTSN